MPSYVSQNTTPSSKKKYNLSWNNHRTFMITRRVIIVRATVLSIAALLPVMFNHIKVGRASPQESLNEQYVTEAQAFFDSGLAKARSEQYEESLSDFRRSIKLDPENFRTYYFIANVQVMLGDNKSAVDSFEMAQVILRRKGQTGWADALRYQKEISIEKLAEQNAPAFTINSNELEIRGDSIRPATGSRNFVVPDGYGLVRVVVRGVEAARYARSAFYEAKSAPGTITLGEQNKQALGYIAYLGRDSDASRLDSTGYAVPVLVYLTIEDEPLPQDVYEQGYPSSEDLVERGRNLALNQQYEEAIVELTREIEVNADNAQAYEARGHSYVLIGNRDAARRDFERATQIHTSQGNTRYAEWLRQFSTQLAEETASSS